MLKKIFTPSREQCFQDKEGGWWNADLERGKEKLAVKGVVTSTASGSKNPDRKADYWSPGRATIKKGERRSETDCSRKSGSVVPDKQPSSTEAEGGFIMCEVEEQQAVRVEVEATQKEVQ